MKMHQVLLFEDNPGDARLIKEFLKESNHGEFSLTHVGSLTEGLDHLANSNCDAILLDLGLPDSQGLDSITNITSIAHNVPVIVLTGLNDLEMSVKAMRAGAQDYLLKGEFNSDLLVRVIHYSIERKLAENAFFESEERYRTVSEYAYNWEYWRSPEGRILYMSPSCERISGYKAGEFIEDPDLLERIVHPEDIPIFNLHQSYDWFEKQTEPVHYAEVRMRRRDGELCWINHVCKPIYNNDGKLLGRRASNIDVTDRKQAEEALKKNQKLLFEAERISHTGAWEWDIQSGLWTVSDEWMKIHGVEKNTFNTEQLYKLADQKDLPRIVNAIEDVLTNGKSYDLRHRVIRESNGETRVVQAYGEVIHDSDGNPIRLIGVAQDITEREQAEERVRQAEKRYQSLIENAPDGVVLINVEGVMIYASPSAKRIFGYEEQEFERFNPSDHTHPEDLPMVQAGLVEIIQNPQKIITLEYRFEHKLGNWLWVESTFTNLLAEPSVGAIVINFREITDRKQMESALLQKQADLKKAQKVAHVGSWVWYTKSNRLEWSDEMYRIFGIDPREFSGDLQDVINRAIHPDDKPAVAASNNSVVQNKKPVPLEYRVVWPDGTQRVVWAEAGDLQFDKDGNPEKLSGIVQDITERKQAERQIVKNLERLRSLYEISQFAAMNVRELLDYALDAAIKLTESKIGYIYFYNEETQQFTLNSWSKDVLEACKVQEPQTLYTLEKTGLWGEAVRQRRPIIENHYRAPNIFKKGYPEGHVVLEKFLTVPIFVNQSIVAVVGAANKETDYDDTDVLQLSLLMDSVWKFVERIKAEEALRLSEIRFRQLVENAPDAIFAETNGRFVYVNPAAMKLIGTENNSDLIGRRIEEFFGPKLMQVTNREQDESAGIQEQLPMVEETCFRLDGNPIDVEVRATPILWEGNEGSLVFLRDITQRKLSEQTLRLQSTALNAAANAMVITDSNGSILWNNPAWSKMTGYSAEEVIGKNPRILKSGEHAPEFYKDLWDTISSGKVWHSEMINRRKDASLYTEDETITPLINENGEVTHYIAVKQDITQRKAAEKMLQEQGIELKKRNELLARLYRVSNALILGTSLDLAKLSQLMVDTIAKEMKNVVCGLYLVNRYNNQLQLSAASDESSPEMLDSMSNLHREKYFEQVLASKETLYVSEELAHPIKTPAGEEVKSIIVTPLKVGERINGVVCILSSIPDYFDADDEQLLSMFSNQGAVVIENATLMEKTREQVNRLQALRRIDETINSSLDLRITVDVLLNQVVKQLNVDAVNFLIYKPESKSLNFVSSLGFNTSALQFSDVRMGQGLAGKAANSFEIVHITNLYEREDFLDSAPLLHKENFIEYYGIPLISKGALKGVLEIYNRSLLSSDDSWHDFLETLAGQAAIAIESIELFDNLQKSISELTHAYDENIEAWSKALDLRDKETEGHTQRVVKMTLRLAKAVGIEGEQLVHIRRGALLHDIGKMGIPDNILLKPGPLTEGEWIIMRKHPVYAYDLLSTIDFLKPSLDIPYCHHERWDGSGYPRGLKGEEIPLSARIFAIVDVWDALRSDRPYRPGWAENDVIDYIREQAGTHFDPKIVELFFKNYHVSGSEQSKATILIVDDEENVTRTLARSLKGEFSVLTANSGSDALDIIRRLKPAVVLTDVRMPDLNGVVLLKRTRSINPETIGILISAYSDVDALTAAINLTNVRGFIAKPWDHEELSQKIQEAVIQYNETLKRNNGNE